MNIFLIIIGILCIIYSIFILLYNYWWAKLTVFEPALHVSFTEPPVKFTVIIPARNEAQLIEGCLHSILDGDYPSGSFEIIVVDDFSTDQTASIVTALKRTYANLSILSLEEILGTRPINSYKKKAIELAIEQSAGAYILTTDADCKVPENWLATFNAYIKETNKKFIAAPVRFVDDQSFLGRFQCLDFLSLQGVTGASVGAGFLCMCNGANLCYDKATFNEVGGFAGIDKLASGDDMLLMHKIYLAYPLEIGFLFTPEVIVDTLPMSSYKTFINQRIRWASKASSYQDWKIKCVLLCVYLWNLALLVLFILGFVQPVLWCWWLGFIGIKFIIEWGFMRKVAGFFGQKHLLRLFFWMQPFHIFYTVIAGFLGLFGSYQWKGRKVQ